MTTRDWQAAVAGGPSWEGKQIIIPTFRAWMRIRVECNYSNRGVHRIRVRVKVRVRV